MELQRNLYLPVRKQLQQLLIKVVHDVRSDLRVTGHHVLAVLHIANLAPRDRSDKLAFLNNGDFSWPVLKNFGVVHK